MSVSVIIPTSGRPALIIEAIQSVCAGTVLPVEIIVVIDSTGPAREEETQAVQDVKRALRRGVYQTDDQALDSMVTINQYYTDDQGPAAARNVGIEAARGEWLAFLDSDDLWQPEKLEKQLAYLHKRPHLKGCQTRELWIKDGRELNQPRHLQPRRGRFLKAAFRHCLISPSSVLMRRDCFDDLGKFDESYLACEDYEFWLRYLARHVMGLVDEPLTIKRSGGWPQQSKKFHSLDALRARAIQKTIENVALNDDELQAAHEARLEKLAIVEAGARKRSGNRVR